MEELIGDVNDKMDQKKRETTYNIILMVDDK